MVVDLVELYNFDNNLALFNLSKFTGIGSILKGRAISINRGWQTHLSNTSLNTQTSSHITPHYYRL